MTKVRDKPAGERSSTAQSPGRFRPKDGPARGEPYALVVLGCAVPPVGLRDGAAMRRVTAAARAWREPARDRAPTLVIASGGRLWGGRVEADAMARELVAQGVPDAKIVRERLSFSTRENARYVAALCEERGVTGIALVTCVWHLPRAVKCFRAEGVGVVEQIPAGERDEGWARRAWIRARERVLAALVETP